MTGLMIEQTNKSSESPAESGKTKRLSGQAGGQVVVRYGRMMQIGLFGHKLKSRPAPGTKLVVNTERGTEIGTVVINVSGDPPWNIEDESLRKYIAASGKGYPFTRGGKVQRRANPQDINDQQHLDKSAKDEASFCREQIKALAIDMKIVAVEHILGGERAVFYFMSEDRVDFRELVKRLAGQYHTRIEMRQIGARDEARLMGDYERCGRQCCCREYLKLLKPVSMRMAKVQKATLDPAKISGRCGRLMCCLRYEDKEYEELRRKLPHRSTWVRTEDGVVGKVLGTQIITQLVRLELIDKRQVAVSNDEIVERDMTAPPKPAPPPERKKPVKTPRPPRQPKPAPEGGAPSDKTAQEQSQKKTQDAGKRRGKSRRRRKKSKHPGALSAPPQVRDGKDRQQPPKNNPSG